MPKTKDKMLAAYLAWKDRPEPEFNLPTVLEGDSLVKESFLIEGVDNEQELSAEEETASAIMDLGSYQCEVIE